MAEEFLWWERGLGQEAEGRTWRPRKALMSRGALFVEESSRVRRALGSSMADSARKAESPA